MRRFEWQRITVFVVLDVAGTGGTALGWYLKGRHNGTPLPLALAAPSFGIAVALIGLGVYARVKRSGQAPERDV